MHNSIKTFDIARGTLQTVYEALFSGPKPRRVIIGLVDAQAASGSAEKNPFNFQHFNVKDVKIQFDGETFPTETIKVDYANDLYAEAYEHLLIGTGAVNDDRSLDISLEDYKNGSAIYIIPLTPADPECTAFDPVRNASLRLEMNFGTAPTATIRAIVMAEYETYYEIDRYRNVHVQH